MTSPKKKDVFIKKVYAIETYALFASNDFVIMAVIAHNRTNKDIGEILNNILEDARLEEESCFIVKHY